MRPPRRRRKGINKKLRLSPVSNVFTFQNGSTFRTELEYENTKHRYPWICSLRTKTSKNHLCAATLLRSSPGPTVLITSAHCALLCKSGETVVDNCCCSNVANRTCSSTGQCGSNPTIEKMSGSDAEVLCGDWIIDGDVQADENYNVVLTIEEVVPHPNFNISIGEGKSQFVQDDIAVLKVADTEELNLNNVHPACFSNEQTSSGSGFQSGWSNPPPLDYVSTYAPGYVQYYEDFSKQWHYKMDLVECRDPVTNNWGEPLQTPSNSFYPPATVCAKEQSREYCLSSGESGSPLMVEDGNGRLRVEGILSFVKGCDNFYFGLENQNTVFGTDGDDVLIGTGNAGPRYGLYQLSENPSVYTRVGCYLPWIAEQFGLSYSGSVDSSCDISSGDPEEVSSSQTCQSTPLASFYTVQQPEVSCIFPFYLNGEKKESCVMLSQDDQLLPVFRCPIRSIKTKIENIDSYNFDQVNDILNVQYCPTDPEVLGVNGLPELDPSRSCPNQSKLSPFATCKNNCRGGTMYRHLILSKHFIESISVNFPVVAGGSALVAAASISALGVGGPSLIGSIVPILLTGTAGIGVFGILLI